MSTKSIVGTQTEKNLVDAYIGESLAYTRYTFYAAQAEKEGYYPISEIFKETAANELRHAKVYFKFLEGGKVAPTGTPIDAGVIGDTASNLATAAAEELSEGVDQYKNAAAVAREEGFVEIAEHFEAIAQIEMHHRERFMLMLKQVKDGSVWKRDHAIKWKCLVCGYIFEGTEPPQTCPGCDHPYQHYMAMDIDELLGNA